MTGQDFLDLAAKEALKVKTFLQTVSGSPITREAEKIIPGLAKIVADFTPVGNLLSALAGIEQVEAVLAAMGAKPMDANDIAKINEDKASDFPR